MAKDARWTEQQKQLLYNHLEKHKGRQGLYHLNRQQAFEDFATEWRRTQPNSDTPDARKVLRAVKALAPKVGMSSYLKLFELGPVECEDRSRRAVSYKGIPDLLIFRCLDTDISPFVRHKG